MLWLIILSFLLSASNLIKADQPGITSRAKRVLTGVVSVVEFVPELAGEEEALRPRGHVEQHGDRGQEAEDEGQRVQDHQADQRVAERDHGHLRVEIGGTCAVSRFDELILLKFIGDELRSRA